MATTQIPNLEPGSPRQLLAELRVQRIYGGNATKALAISFDLRAAR